MSWADHIDLAANPIVAARAELAAEPAPAEVPTPVTTADRTKNPLRPTRLDEIVGQERTVRMLRRVIDATLSRSAVLDHVLLVGPSGTGKSTFANVIANELGADVYQVEAPVSHETLLELREVMRDGDVLFIDEIHQQAIAERRGRSASTTPEVLFNVMEDRTIVSGYGVLSFPQITVMGATTDEGMLPDPFINRFPLRPVLDPYTEQELTHIALLNAKALDVPISADAAIMFARACRGVPRQINNYVLNARILTTGVVNGKIADEVLDDLNRVTADGLTLDMQRALTFIYRNGRRTNTGTGETTYKASVGAIATGIGKSRDAKAVQLRVEPFLIQEGLLTVGHGGRQLTPAGIKRARELMK